MRHDIASHSCYQLYFCCHMPKHLALVVNAPSLGLLGLDLGAGSGYERALDSFMIRNVAP